MSVPPPPPSGFLLHGHGRTQTSAGFSCPFYHNSDLFPPSHSPLCAHNSRVTKKLNVPPPFSDRHPAPLDCDLSNDLRGLGNPCWCPTGTPLPLLSDNTVFETLLPFFLDFLTNMLRTTPPPWTLRGVPILFSFWCLEYPL